MRTRLALALGLLLAAGAAGHAADLDLALGNPSRATADPDKKTNYLDLKKHFALSYNNDTGTPNWVSWHLAKTDLGEAPRKSKFTTDAALPAGFHRVTHNDYTGSGFDRGHMCPHGDRAADKEMSYSTFLMTNIVPQSNENNSGAWNQLELYGRHLVETKGKELFIVAGPHGVGGEGREGAAKSLANGRVTVPKVTWKVIAVLDAGAGDPVKRVDAKTRLIAVVMPNDRTVPKNNWWKYRVSVKAVEELTGYTFFDKVPAAVIDPLKKVADGEYIPVLERERDRE